MISLPTLRLVAAGVLLLDAMIGMCAPDFWQRLVPAVNVRRMIVLETIAAGLILVIHHAVG